MANHSTPGSSHEGYEKTDAHAKPLLWFALGLVILSAASFWLMAVMYKAMDNHTNKTDKPSVNIRDSRWRAPDIQLEVHPSKLREELTKAETEHLTTYGWVDAAAKKVRIPIERAIQITAQKGLPFRKSVFSEREGSAALTESGGQEAVSY